MTSPASSPTRRKVRSTLFWVILISAGVHVLAGLIVGSWTIYKYTRPPEAIFESPPPAVKVPPQNIEYKVQMQQMQRESARPQNQVAAQVDQLLNQQITNVSSNMAAMVTPALAGAPIVSSGRTGGGRIGGGAGIGFGVSAVNFFGIEKKGERVVFIVDAGASMVEPERGDLPGYDRVKAELIGMIDGLSPGTFFNVIVFERGVNTFKPELVVATQDNKAAVAEWIGPYWRLKDGKIEQRGSFRRNYEPDNAAWPSDGGSSRMDLALITAFEMRSDLIFMITDGTPSIQKFVSEEAREAHRQALKVWREERKRYEESESGKRAMEKFEREMAEWRKAGQSRKDAENAARAKKGLPPIVRENPGDGDDRPNYPGPKGPYLETGYYNADEIVVMARRMAANIYGADNREWPTVNVVGYSASPRALEFIKKLDAGFPDSSWRDFGGFDASK